MDVNDKYLLEITSSAKGINKVAGDLDRLKESLKGFTFSPAKVTAFTNFSNSITTFGKAVSNIDTGKIIAFSTAMKQLGDVKIKLPKGMDETVKSIEKAFTGLGDSKELYKKVNSFSRIMQPLSDLKFGGVNGVSKSIENLDKALDNLDFRKIHGQADALNRTLAPLASTMDKLSSASMSLGFNKSFGKGIGNAYQGLQDVLSGSTKKSGSTKGAEDNTPFANIRKALDSLYDSTIGKISTPFDKAREKVAQLADQLSRTKFAEFFRSGIAVAQKFFSVLKKGISIVGSLAKAMSNIGFLNPFRGIAESVNNVIKKLKTLWSSLARIAMYRALRSAIKEIAKAVREGLTNLYYWSQATGGDFAPAVDKLATAFLYLKNSIGASVSPLITYFAPAIDLAVDKIVELINVVNQLFARLTGRATWTRALKYPTEFAERAGGATKKVKDNIQDFDELHILRTPNGGGGSDSMDYNNMFEETEFTQGLTDWIENLKDAIKAGRWYEAGNIIADEINKVINNINWGKLGTTLGNKINDMFSFAWGFLHNIDFVKIGSSIATFLNNAINTIDTYQIGQVLARKWTMIFDTLYGFVSTFDFPAFGWKVSELVEGWFDEIDGERIGTTISDAIKGALDSAIAFMSNDSMLDKFVEDVAGIINNIDWYGIFCRVLTIATQIANALSDVINSVLDGRGRQSNTGFDASRVTASAPEAIAQRVVANQNYAVSRGWTGTFGDQFSQGLADSINNADTASLIEALKNLFKAVWRAVKKTLGAIFKEGSTEIIAQFVDSVTGSHLDAGGNRVSSGAGHGNVITGNSYLNRSGTLDRINEAEDELPWYLQSPAHTVINLITGKNASRNVDRLNKSMSNLSVSTERYGDAIGKATIISKDFSIQTVEGVKGVETAFDNFGDKINGDVVNRVLQSKNTISATITSLSDDTKFKMNEMSSSIFASVDNTDKAITTPLSNIKTQITTTFREAGSDASNSIKGMGETMNASLKGVVDASKGHLEGYNDLWSQLKGNIKGVSNTVIEGSEKMGNGVTDAFNSILDNLNNFKITTPDGYKFDYNLKKLPKISIPRLATGGIATSATTALIGEAGKEAVLPLENNTEWMNVLAERINGEGNDEVALLREQNDLLRQIASKNVTISSREIFNAVRDENDEYVTRTGKSALAL